MKKIPIRGEKNEYHEAVYLKNSVGEKFEKLCKEHGVVPGEFKRQALTQAIERAYEKLEKKKGKAS